MYLRNSSEALTSAQTNKNIHINKWYMLLLITALQAALHSRRRKREGKLHIRVWPRVNLFTIL